MSPRWMDRAACNGHVGELFFAPDHEVPRARDRRVAAAKVICGTCPVARECLAYAEEHDEKHGIWGGLTEKERGKDVDSEPRKKAANHVHGTPWGAQRHRANGEEPCPSCKASVNRKMADWKRKKAS